MVFIPILEVCNGGTGYKGDGVCRETWWRQMTAREQTRVTLENILAATRVKRQESGRRGEGGGGGEVAEYDSRS